MRSNIRRKSILFLSAAAIAAIPQISHAQIDDDEIIVTATKRATSVQDVPISVTVVNPAQLENQGVTSIKDLSSVASGFNIQSSQTETQGTSIRIRGVGTTGNNIGLESAVGVFIDGVYQSRPGVALGELTDIEALELLRGPQGTLFGRNTSAGALNIRTKKPDFDGTSGFADFTYGNFDLINVKGAVNFTASDQLAFRVNGAYRQRDGFLESSLDDDIESHDRDRFLIRGQALWEPSDVTSLRLIADYSEIDENCCAAVNLVASPLLGAGVNTLFPALGFEDGLEAQTFNDQGFTNGSDSFGISGELVHDFGNVEATLIGSYRDFSAFSTQQDFNASLQYSVPQLDDDIETITAELRFQGNAFDDRLDWLIGGYWADETIDEIFALELGADYSTSVSLANTGNPGFLSLFSAAGQGLLQAGAGLAPITHNIFSVTDKLDLTVGVRYNDDSKDGSFTQSSFNNDACVASLTLAGSLGGAPAATGAALASFVPAPFLPTVASPASGTAAFLNCFPFAAPVLSAVAANPAAAGAGQTLLPRLFDDNFSDDEFIYTVKADYDITDDVLAYASFSHGYKAGGFNLDPTAAQGGSDPRFNSEEVDSYELGIKTTLADGRVRFNLTGFYSTFDNFQVLEFTGTRFQTFNVDDVSSKGIEAELNARLSDAVSLNGGLTYADAEYGDDCDRGGTIAPATLLCGFSLTNAPEISATQSDRRTSTNPQVALGVLNPLDTQNGVTKVNARLGFSMPGDRASIEFWGLNLTDQITRGITFNTPLQGTGGVARSAFTESPRQYGVTVRTNF